MDKLNFPKVDQNTEMQQSFPKESIFNHHQINGHIFKVCQQGVKLKIRIDDNPMQFDCHFIDRLTTRMSDGIMIKTLRPLISNCYIKKSNKGAISHNLDGTDYTFESKYLQRIEGSHFFHMVSIPKVILKEQRKFLRIAPLVDSPILIYSGGNIAGKVRDISVGGLSFYTALTKDELELGKTLDEMSIFPIDNQKIDTKAVVLRFSENVAYPKKGKNKCSIKFCNIKRSDVKKIALYNQKSEPGIA